MRRIHVRWAGALAAVTLASCSLEGLLGLDRARRSEGGISVSFGMKGSSYQEYLSMGDTATLRATAYSSGWGSRELYDSYASESDARRFRWTSSDSTVATIGPTGLVTARRAGETRLTVTGDRLDGFTLVLRVYPAVASLDIDPASIDVAVGGGATVRVIARDASGQPVVGVPLIFASSDPAVAGATSNPRQSTAAGDQPVYAWRAGTATLRAVTLHARRSAWLQDSVTIAVRDPGVAPDTLRRRNTDPDLRIEVGRSTLRRGDTTTVRLVLHNRGRTTERFTASASCAATFDVHEAGGRIAWPLGDGRPPCSASTTFTLAPGDSLVRQVLWRADNGGTPTAAPLAPGLYYLFAAAGGQRRDGTYFQAVTRDVLVIRVLP
jgi:hypothetical protein